MKTNDENVNYEVVVFNDRYGHTVRNRCDIDRQSGFTRLPNGVIQHDIPEKNQVRYGYVIASGPKREMSILADSLKALYDGLKMQSESREFFNHMNAVFGDFDNWKRFSIQTFKDYRYIPIQKTADRLSPKVTRNMNKRFSRIGSK